MVSNLKNNLADYDVVVVGAGIQGAGIAQFCAAAGYSCLVLEKNAVGGATSSASSKLIHGGLRYLESAQFSLVYECLQERAWLINNAPELVRPLPFYIPIYKQSTRQSWTIAAGLSLYAVLSGLNKYSRFDKLKRHEWDSIPFLKQKDLKAIFQYWDAATDDQLLAESVMHSARTLGAKLVCPGEFISVKREKYLNTVEYEVDGERKQLTTFMLINAAGPWINKVQSASEPELYQLPVELVQGSHLVLAEKILDDKILYLEHPRDQRALFVMPWYDNTLLGTTEHVLERYEKPQMTQYEKDYLLEFWRYYFPDMSATVLDSMAGVRVLPKEQSSSVFSRSRDARILTGRGNIAVYGGKLTGFRTVSKKVLKEIERQLGKRKTRADVDKIVLSKVS